MPDPGGSIVRPRPIVDVVVEGLEIAPQACLIDCGSTAVRMGAHVAALCGLDLVEAPRQKLAAGGEIVSGSLAEVGLRLGDGHDEHRWLAPVWFCEPWRPAFGLLGLTGFFDQFVVTIVSHEKRIDLIPLSR